VNFDLFSKREKILGSSVSMLTFTVLYSLKGFLKVSIDDVLFPTEVEMG